MSNWYDAYMRSRDSTVMMQYADACNSMTGNALLLWYALVPGCQCASYGARTSPYWQSDYCQSGEILQ